MWEHKESFEKLEGLLHEVLRKQNTNHELLERFMSTNAVTQEQFAADLETLNTNVATAVTTLTGLDGSVKSLKDEVAALKANNPAVDFSTVDAKVKAMSDQITGALTTVQPEVNGQAPAA